MGKQAMLERFKVGTAHVPVLISVKLDDQAA
jgi:hypothetical protein